MNFKLKTLVTAAVLAASATSANAAIQLGANTAGSELVFSAWSTAGVGYTFDLLSALTATSFFGADGAASGAGNAAGNATVLANAVVNSSLITGPNGQILDVALTGIPFSSAATNVQWSLTALDNSGRTRLMTTIDSSITSPGTITSNDAKAAVTTLNGYYAASEGFVPVAGDDTYALTNDTNGAAYAGNAGDNVAGYMYDNTNLLGSSSFLYLLAQSTQASSSIPALQKQFATAAGENLVATTYLQGNQWRLNLSVAAIPEPETYAMFLAGLGMMGAVARRRKGQVK
jgi:hypothetical protein